MAARIVMCEPTELYNILQQATSYPCLSDPNYLLLLGKLVQSVVICDAGLELLARRPQRPLRPWPLLPLVLAFVSIQKFPINFKIFQGKRPLQIKVGLAFSEMKFQAWWHTFEVGITLRPTNSLPKSLLNWGKLDCVQLLVHFKCNKDTKWTTDKYWATLCRSCIWHTQALVLINSLLTQLLLIGR